ncbi:unnamed protein product [Linum tenue]|uniref:Uncharacterized protein n=2 Tax=Linum tenue TaxID=586396 RepID=A0AAV0HY81_9ROSI|nr:unnamed protein product [Linum tenue]
MSTGANPTRSRPSGPMWLPRHSDPCRCLPGRHAPSRVRYLVQGRGHS